MRKRKEDTTGVYRRGRIWWMSYTSGGKQNCISTHRSDKKEAIAYRQEYLTKLEKATQEQRVGHLFAYVVNEFLNELDTKLKNNKIRLKTYKQYDDYIFKHNGILSFFKDRIINNINLQDIKLFERLLLNNGASDGYVIKHLKILKTIFNFAFKMEYIDKNIFDRYNFFEVYSNYGKREDIYNIDEIQAIIKNSNKQLSRLIIFLVNACSRISETLKLLKKDIIIDNGTMWVVFRAENTKSKKERRIPLNKYARLSVEAQCRDFPNSIYIFTDEKGNNYKTDPKTALKTACKKAGVNMKGFHIFRHTGATLLYNGKNFLGEDIGLKSKEAISELLGHSDLKITNIYLNDNKELLKSLLEEK